MNPQVPTPESTTSPGPRYLGRRHLLVEVGNEVHLRDRLRPDDEPLATFSATPNGWASALSSLRRIDGPVLDTRSGRTTSRHVPNPDGSRRRLLGISFGVILLMLVASVPLARRLIDSGSTAAGPRILQSELIGRVQSSTMLVLAYRETVTAEGILQEWHVGSGWVYDVSEGLIVTNAHVVRDGAEFQAGPSTNLEAATREAIAFCGELDLAILRVGTISLPALAMAPDDSARPGDPVYAAGYPPSRVGSTSTRTVSTIPLSWSAGEIESPPSGVGGEYVFHSAELDHGNSGGPLVNTSGELVGMNTAMARASGVGVAIPVDVLRETIPRLLRNEDVCGSS
jgi:S1-C subfamily serine protease